MTVLPDKLTEYKQRQTYKTDTARNAQTPFGLHVTVATPDFACRCFGLFVVVVVVVVLAVGDETNSNVNVQQHETSRHARTDENGKPANEQSNRFDNGGLESVRTYRRRHGVAD